MHTNLSSLRRTARLIWAGAALAFPGIRAAAADAPAQADAFPDFESYIKISGQKPWITGDDAAYATRTGTPTTGSGGIEDLFVTKDLSDVSTLKINGHAMAGSEDYLGSVNIAKSDFGSIEVGYKRFRTFYDGVGGFFPLSDTFERLSAEELHVDRSSFWAEAKFAKPDCPTFTVSFHDEVRTGMKDSTEWAPVINPDADVVKGALVGTAVPANTPEIGPNVMQLDEHHDILEASMTAKAGKTTETLKGTLDTVNNIDSRGYVRYPNSNVIADPTVVVQDDQESRRSTSFRILSQTETKITDWFAVELGLTYMHLSDTNGGSWITPAYSATALAVYPADTAANIYGGSKYDDYVGNLFLKFTPDKNWDIEAGLREESDVTSSSGGFMTTSLSSTAKTTAAANVTTANDLTYSHYSEHVETPEVSVQYHGFEHLSLYASFDDRVNRGNQQWVNPYAAITTTGAGVVTTAGAPIGSVYFQQANQDYENAKIGANWSASNSLSIRAEVFRKVHQNKFIGSDDVIGTASYGALYVTGYALNGAKLSVVIKPAPEITFSTRYQPQIGMMSVLGNTVTGGNGTEVTSGKTTIQLISETIDWTPSPRVYVQGNVNVVYNCIQTSYPVVVVSTTTYVPTPVLNSDNNYITGSALCGFVVDKDTDAQLQGMWSKADDYNPQVAPGGQPYGSSYLEESATVGLKHKFGNRLIAEGKVGYLRRTDPTTGGFTNYRGPLAYVGLTYSL